jgi:hypothetical protein
MATKKLPHTRKPRDISLDEFQAGLRKKYKEQEELVYDKVRKILLKYGSIYDEAKKSKSGEKRVRVRVRVEKKSERKSGEKRVRVRVEKKE